MTEKEIEAYFVKRVKALGGYAKTKQNYVCLWSKAGVDEWADHLN